MTKKRTLILFAVFSLFACNVDGANGIFYAITQEVESGNATIDVKMTPKGRIETEDFLFLVANGLHVSFKDGRIVNEYSPQRSSTAFRRYGTTVSRRSGAGAGRRATCSVKRSEHRIESGATVISSRSTAGTSKAPS